jgi:hypothetical protein
MMDCMYWFAFAPSILCILITTGCSDEGGPSGVMETRSAIDATSPLAEQRTNPSVSFCGHLEGNDGVVLQQAKVIVCNGDVCFNEASGTTGAFCVQVASPGRYMFHAAGQKAGTTLYGDVLFPVAAGAAQIEERGREDLGTIVLPVMGKGVTLDRERGGMLELGEEMTLSVPPAVTSAPPLLKEIVVAAASVNVGVVHPRLQALLPGAGDPAAVYLFLPLGVSFSSPIAFSLPRLDPPLPTGTSLSFLWLNGETGEIEIQGKARVTDQGALKNVEGGGLRSLGWFFFLKE